MSPASDLQRLRHPCLAGAVCPGRVFLVPSWLLLGLSAGVSPVLLVALPLPCPAAGDAGWPASARRLNPLLGLAGSPFGLVTRASR